MNAIIKYFENLGVETTQELKIALAGFKKRSYKKGDILVQEGQVCKAMFFITKGKTRHYYNIDGDEYTRWVSLENNFETAMVSFIRQTPSKEIIECIEHCEILYMSHHDFMQLKKTHPIIQQLWAMALENDIIGYEERVCMLISVSSEKRYLDYLEAYPLHAQEVPQKYIASMLGIAPRHLSRIRKKLANPNK